MCNHFDILTWQINLPNYTKHEIENEIYPKSVFIHEYIHYCQTLASTIGRVYLTELLRISLRTGIFLNFGDSLPKIEKQIDLWDSLQNAKSSQLIGTPPYHDYHSLLNDLDFVYAGEPVLFNGIYNSSFPFHFQNLSISQNTRDNFPHILSEINSRIYMIPISDLVIFENMARQIQRKFLIFSGLKNELLTLDSLRTNPNYVRYELTRYTSIYDYLTRVIQNGEDVSKWTITLCQFALMCQFPGEAIIEMSKILSDKVNQNIQLEEFIELIRRKDYFINVYNQPRIQSVINDLINKLGTVMLPHENNELRELIKLLTNLINSINDKWSYFSQDIWVDDHLRSWIRSFGCPPVQCRSGVLNEIFGLETNTYWHRYLLRIEELMN